MSCPHASQGRRGCCIFARRTRWRASSRRSDFARRHAAAAEMPAMPASRDVWYAHDAACRQRDIPRHAERQTRRAPVAFFIMRGVNFHRNKRSTAPLRSPPPQGAFHRGFFVAAAAVAAEENALPQRQAMPLTIAGAGRCGAFREMPYPPGSGDASADTQVSEMRMSYARGRCEQSPEGASRARASRRRPHTKWKTVAQHRSRHARRQAQVRPSPFLPRAHPSSGYTASPAGIEEEHRRSYADAASSRPQWPMRSNVRPSACCRARQHAEAQLVAWSRPHQPRTCPLFTFVARCLWRFSPAG